jgi:hypothetical protein
MRFCGLTPPRAPPIKRGANTKETAQKPVNNNARSPALAATQIRRRIKEDQNPPHLIRCSHRFKDDVDAAFSFEPLYVCRG